MPLSSACSLATMITHPQVHSCCFVNGGDWPGRGRGYELTDSVDGLQAAMPVDLATADLLMGANNGPSASTISVSDDLADINSYGSLSSFGSVTATGVTLAEADNCPLAWQLCAGRLRGRFPGAVPVDLATADLLMGANNGLPASAISVLTTSQL